MSRPNSKKNSSKSQDFSQNYQKVINNYSSLIKFYTNNTQIMDGIEKIIISYKESIISFKKKLIQLKLNLIKPFYNEEKKSYKYEEQIYSFNNNFIYVLNQIINFQIDLITNLFNDIEKNLFSEFEKKRINDFSNSLQQTKNNIQTNEKKMEKLYSEYNSEYKKFYDTFNLIEEDVQKYYINKRKIKFDDTNNNKINRLTNEANFVQNNFLQIHNKFQENNKNYFDEYNEKINEFEKETIKNETYMKNNINLFLQILIKSYKSFLNSMDDFIKKNKVNISTKEEKDINEINENLIIGEEQSKQEEEKKSVNLTSFKEKYFLLIQSNYNKDKYKVKTIHCHIVGDGQSIEDTEIMDNIFNEMGLEEYVKNTTVILSDEVIFETVKFFYGKFNFVDTSDYNINLEKKKLEVKKLTYKLLQPGLLKKDYDEYKDVKPINDNDVKKLENYINKEPEFRLAFLLNINFYRTSGIFDMPEKEFDITGKLFLEIIDIILNGKDKDFQAFKLITILSQTFYVNKDGKKIYLFNKLKGHKIFSQTDFIKQYLNYSLNEEFQKVKLKSDREISLNEKQSIVFANILPFSKCMIEFGVPKQTLLEMNESLYKEYELSEDLINDINAMLEVN